GNRKICGAGACHLRGAAVRDHMARHQLRHHAVSNLVHFVTVRISDHQNDADNGPQQRAHDRFRQTIAENDEQRGAEKGKERQLVSKGAELVCRQRTDRAGAVTSDHDENGNHEAKQKKPQQALTHGDYPLKRRRQALGWRARSRSISAVACGVIIGLGESIGSGITLQDKGATAERNPPHFVPAVRPQHALATKIDCFSTVHPGACLTESRPVGFGRRAGRPNGDAVRLRREEATAMKLYDGGRAPNPRRVRIFLAEKGIKVPAEQIDLGALQQRTEAYTAINPMQRVPALVLDDGTVIAESIAICRYFEELNPAPPLFGVGVLPIALVELSHRRAELHLLFPVASVFQHLHPAMSRMVDPQVPQWGEANKPRVMQFLEFLDRELKDRAYVAGADYTVADITALVAVDFMRVSKM